MSSRSKPDSEFPWWRIAGLLCAAGLVALGVRFLKGAADHSFVGAAGFALIGMGCLGAAAICIGPSMAGFISEALTGWLGGLFYPKSTFTKPTEALLLALRMRLKDRQWPAVTQQIDALIKAYGPSAELFHLRAHLVAGQTGDYKSVTAEAKASLHKREYARYLELLRSNPPPDSIQTGIDA